MVRFLSGVVVGALLGVAGTVVGAVAAGAKQPRAEVVWEPPTVEVLRERVATIVAPREETPGPVTVFVSRDGARVDAQASAVLFDRKIREVEIPRFRGGDRKWNTFRRCLDEQFAPFAVNLVDAQPDSGEFITLHVGGSPRLFGLSKKTGGIAPLNGDVIRDAHVFTFERKGVSARDMCEIAAHEVGHALGLDHSRACRDIMSYGACGKKSFRDHTHKCGEFETRECINGEAGQNSHQHLLRSVGARDEHEVVA